MARKTFSIQDHSSHSLVSHHGYVDRKNRRDSRDAHFCGQQQNQNGFELSHFQFRDGSCLCPFCVINYKVIHLKLQAHYIKSNTTLCHLLNSSPKSPILKDRVPHGTFLTVNMISSQSPSSSSPTCFFLGRSLGKEHLLKVDKSEVQQTGVRSKFWRARPVRGNAIIS